jgi:enoyl-CoA hydratase
MSWNTLKVEEHGAVAWLELHRPQALNALNAEIMEELTRCLEQMDAREDIRVIVVSGDDRAFAAGADIKEMAEASHIDMYLRNNIARWDRVRRVSKPVIAAVSGFALGGGCELAMCCDLIVASETAQFGQPEINLGVMPGAGGTQRLTRALGKARAMDMILTGRMLSAQEALERGLVARVASKGTWREETLALAKDMAKKSPLALRLAKECVLKAFETPLAEGLEYERRSFYMMFGSHDQVEGMKAFIEKRPATFTGK